MTIRENLHFLGEELILEILKQRNVQAGIFQKRNLPDNLIIFVQKQAVFAGYQNRAESNQYQSCQL